MNWFRTNPDEAQPNDASVPDSNNNTTPDASELRRRRVAKLEAAQVAEKQRRKDFEERKAKWEAEQRAKNIQKGIAPPLVQTPPPPKPKPKPKPEEEPVRKRKAAPLPTLEEMLSKALAKSLGLALIPSNASDELIYYPDLVAQLRVDSSLPENQPLLLSVDQHTDDILINRINSDNEPLRYLFTCFSQCDQQTSEVFSNRRIAGAEHKNRREKLQHALDGVQKRIVTYSGMALSGSFMDTENVTPEIFTTYILADEVPAGFLRALLNRYSEEDSPGIQDLEPVFIATLKSLRGRAVSSLSLSSSNFLKPYKALAALLSHKEICRILTSDRYIFLSEVDENVKSRLQDFSGSSFLYPFFKISALPGLPLHLPGHFPEDPTIATSMFPNASMLQRTEAESSICSLRSSLGVARTLLHQISLSIFKAGPESKKAMLTWFATVCNLNKKRTAMNPDPREISGDGFMFNIMHVLLKLCDPIIDGGWKMLEKIDPYFPQTNYRIDYSDETRLAADTDMLKRWWVDPRNENAQESLTRQLEVTAREAGLPHGSNNASSSTAQKNSAPLIPSEFNFVTECFFLALRSVQLSFMAIANTYSKTILPTLQRLQKVIIEMEENNASGAVQPGDRFQLKMVKRKFDSFLQIKFCYDVYLKDPECLTTLVRFAAAVAEWLLKKMLSQPERSSLLPLPVPPDPVFASLPEHTVEAISSVLLQTMSTDPHIVEDNSVLLEDIVSFCIVGSASPLHIKNPYLRSKLVEFLSCIFPSSPNLDREDDDNEPQQRNPAMEALFAGHKLSRDFLPAAMFRLYVDVEHTGSHTQFYDKFSIRFRIGTILESLWYMRDYRRSVQKEARDESRFLRFINMVLNDANHLLDSALNELEQIHSLQTMIEGNSQEWQALSEEEQIQKKDHLQKLEGSVKAYNQLSNNNVKLICLLTDDVVARRVFLRPEMVSRMTEMLNYLLDRLCGKRCTELKVSDPEKYWWKPRLLLRRIMQTYIHFHGEAEFAASIAKDGRSYKADLFMRAIRISTRKALLSAPEVQKLQDIADSAARAHEEDNQEEEDLGVIPEEYLDPIMSILMRNPVRLPTSGIVMDRSVISRILLSDQFDPFNRKLLTEDMLVPAVELREKILNFVAEKRNVRRNS